MPEKPPHPPAPGGIVHPNYLSIEEALGNVTFPISKQDLMAQLEGGVSALLNGRNVDLRELVRDLNDDFFDNEEELHDAMEREYGLTGDNASFGIVPTGSQEDWQTTVGPGNIAGADDYIEPPDGL